MYSSESWPIKKAECRRMDAFEKCWRRLLRVPWTAKRSVNPKGSQPWIFIGRTDAKAEAPILWPPVVKGRLIGKDPDAGKDWRQEEKGQQRMTWLDGITNSMEWVWANSRRWWRTVKPDMPQSMGSQSQTWLSGLSATTATVEKYSSWVVQEMAAVLGSAVELWAWEGKGQWLSGLTCI